MTVNQPRDHAPELIADYACSCGENPLWHPDEKRLYWTDISTGRIFRYDPSTGEHEQCYDGPQVGGFTIQEDGALCLFMEKGTIRTWRDGFVETIVPEIADERDSRFNDVIADPKGRVFAGTMATENHPGRLYRVGTDGELAVVLDDCGGPNGMGFTPDRTGMYFTDSTDRTVWLFDYDVLTGGLSNRRVFARTDEKQGTPDGMTVDTEGYVWSARWDGSCVARYTPDGAEVERIEFPVPKTSSCVFGGEDYADLYITTAGGSDRSETPRAGALFRVRPGVSGVAEFRSRLQPA